MTTKRISVGLGLLSLVLVLLVWGTHGGSGCWHHLVTKVEAKNRVNNELVMVAYARELDNYIKSTNRAEVSLIELQSILDRGASPYPLEFGKLRVVSCDNDGVPVDNDISHLCSQIGYYSDGQRHKLFVWGDDNQLVLAIWE